MCAVLQKYIDQGISVNTSYNPAHFDESKIEMSQLLKDIIMFYKYGGKQLYYNNTHDESGEMDIEDTTELEQIIDDGECESCVI